MEMEMEIGEKDVCILSSSDVYIPQELWVQYILPRVSVKALLRFRCVCKYWCSLIDDPNFIYIHFKQYKNNCQKNRILALERLGYNGFRGSRFTIRETLTLRKTTHVLKTSELYRLLGSCHGLFLLQFGKQLKLWNPSVRKCVTLPFPYPFRGNKVILGYAPLTNDYKVVILKLTFSTTRDVSIAIYSLNNNTWRTKVVRAEDIVTDDFTEGIPYVYFQGAAYWIDPDQWYNYWDSSSSRNKLGFFDFDTEELRYAALPVAPDNWYEQAYDWDKTRCLFLLGESLAIFNVSPIWRSVWVMETDGEKRSWSLWFSGDSTKDYLRSFKDQVVFLDFSYSRIFFEENSGTSFLYGKNCCKITGQDLECLGKAMSRHITLEPYVESLVLSRGYSDRTMTPFPGAAQDK